MPATKAPATFTIFVTSASQLSVADREQCLRCCYACCITALYCPVKEVSCRGPCRGLGVYDSDNLSVDCTYISAGIRDGPGIGIGSCLGACAGNKGSCYLNNISYIGITVIRCCREQCLCCCYACRITALYCPVKEVSCRGPYRRLGVDDSDNLCVCCTDISAGIRDCPGIGIGTCLGTCAWQQRLLLS